MALILTVALASLAAPSAALALPFGGLTQPSGTAGCTKYNGADGCATDSLVVNMQDVATSPDGKNVYMVSLDGLASAVVGFSRDPVSGTLGSRVSCATETLTSGCETPSLGAKLQSGYAIDVSPDGKNVYAVGSFSQTVLTFNRDASTGALSYASCNSSAVIAGCTLGTAGQLDGADGIDVSPDGKSVYVVASNASSIVRYDRNSATGGLTEAYCFKYLGGSGCDPAPVPALANPNDVEVSPDGNNVYVASGSEGVVDFSRDATGAISPLPGTGACVGPSSPCAPGHDFSQLNKIAISPDGNSVYGASVASNAIDVLTRAPNGSLSQQAGVAGAVPLGKASSVLASPDGKNVYAGTGYNEFGVQDSLAIYDRGSGGALTQLASPNGCFDTVGSPCTVGRELNDVTSLAMPSQGNSLYTSAYGSGAIGTYVRALPPVCQDISRTFRNDEGGEIQLSCSDPNGDPVTSYAISTPPAHGTVKINQGNGKANYSPTGRYHGADSFKFTGSDGSISSDPATASIALTDQIGPLVEFGNQKLLRLSKTGSTKVTLKCPKTEVDGCPKGKLTIGSSRRINITLKRKRKAKLSLGKANYTLAAGQTKSVRVKLNRTARRVVRHLRNVRVNMTATSRDPAGNTGKTTKATRIKAKR